MGQKPGPVPGGVRGGFDPSVVYAPAPPPLHILAVLSKCQIVNGPNWWIQLEILIDWLVERIDRFTNRHPPLFAMPGKSLKKHLETVQIAKNPSRHRHFCVSAWPLKGLDAELYCSRTANSKKHTKHVSLGHSMHFIVIFSSCWLNNKYQNTKTKNVPYSFRVWAYFLIVCRLLFQVSVKVLEAKEIHQYRKKRNCDANNLFLRIVIITQ